MNARTIRPLTIRHGQLAFLLALFLLLASVILAATSRIALAQDEPPFSEDVVTATTTANLRIRSAPDLDAEVLTILPYGSVVGFTGFTDETGDWVQVDAADGPVGWVWRAFLSNIPDDLTALGEVGTVVEGVTTDEPSFSEDVVTATTIANVRLRNAPDLDAEVLTILPFDTVVGFTGFTDETGDWVQVDAAGGPIGWIWGDYLSNLPDDLTALGPDGTVEEEEAVDDEPAFSEDVVTAITTANLRIRSAPSLDGEVLATLPVGTVVGFTGLTDETGGWVQVDVVDGPVGWVWGEFLSNVPDDLTVWIEG